MNQALLNSLTDAERLLMAETERDVLKRLDEDELLELHQRIRRARTKYVKNYRRAASSAVAARGGRGFSYPKNQRDRGKAELFESALARVSREVASAATRASTQLRAERIEAARSNGSATSPKTPPATKTPATKSTATKSTATKTRATRTAQANKAARATKTTGGLKKDASTRAAGARRQAKRDAR
ncbi:hypothetical protein AB0L70_21640 [Kribbella sp. NPDC051952]|uniref:hypothetical protein n=1 Tax=Kribbella sp. NPDC051952 TaxID=3154851 RepID=UPI0034378259